MLIIIIIIIIHIASFLIPLNDNTTSYPRCYSYFGFCTHFKNRSQQIDVGIVVDIAVNQLARRVILVDRGLAACVVGDRMKLAAGIIPLGINSLKRTACTCIIADFTNSVNLIVQIFYFETVSVVQLLQFAVPMVVLIRCQLIVTRRNSRGISKPIVGEAIGCRIGADLTQTVGGIFQKRHRTSTFGAFLCFLHRTHKNRALCLSIINLIL